MNSVWIFLLPADLKKKHNLGLFHQRRAQEMQYDVQGVNWPFWAFLKKKNLGLLGLIYYQCCTKFWLDHNAINIYGILLGELVDVQLFLET